LSYYLFGSLCLPESDFAALTDLPKMYRHCKSTEQTDMSPLDFITDHLLNIDGVFDKHENGDEQKPHSPFTYHHQLSQNIFIVQHCLTSISEPTTSNSELSTFTEQFYLFDYVSEILRPPIV